MRHEEMFVLDFVSFLSDPSPNKLNANASKLVEKCFLELKNIFFNQENITKFFSKQEDLSS